MTVDELFHGGRLEQTCPACGRWEAAHWYCSWCSRPTGPEDWYRNGDRAERAARLPKAAPGNPPVEFRRAYREDQGGWPPQWGPCPYLRATPRGTGGNGGPDESDESLDLGL